MQCARFQTDRSAMGCRFCEASLSKVLCSGGCSGCSSSLMAQLQRCSRRDGRPDSHSTCWFLSEWTNNCSTFATANCSSKACWETGELRGIKPNDRLNIIKRWFLYDFVHLGTFSTNFSSTFTEHLLNCIYEAFNQSQKVKPA